MEPQRAIGPELPMTTTSTTVRQHLIDALRADLVGPFDPSGQELLELPPSRWYLSGFLAPEDDNEPEDPGDEEELGGGDDLDVDEAQAAEPEPKRPSFMPASIGLSVLVPPCKGDDTVSVVVRWADYVRHEPPARGERQAQTHKGPTWQRVPREVGPIEIPLTADALSAGVDVPTSRGLRIVGHLKTLGESRWTGMDSGVRAVAVFLVNQRAAATEKGFRDEAYVFQVQLEVTASCGLLPKANLRDGNSKELDPAIADVQFRDVLEYVVGHGVSAEHFAHADGRLGVRTCWLPEANVRRVRTRDQPGVMVSMEALTTLQNGKAAVQALSPLPDAYLDWIATQRGIELNASRADTRDRLMANAERAASRIREGIALLASNDEVFCAFKLANQAMAVAARRRSPTRYATPDKVPEWRLFQLAFILLNLPSVADDAHKDRDLVELIFFPTGGGKTEAYLGLIAFALTLRRMRGHTRPDKGLGVAILLRYTLRLLTLDQLGRAATLICALERIRLEASSPLKERLGPVRFAIGLWVGRSATANTLKHVSRQITDYKGSTAKNAISPCPITHCPWCGEALGKTSFALMPDHKKPEEVMVGCSDWRCDFSGKNGGLPVVFVDEQIYQELPCFIVATVDKFAMLPWRGETGKLFGRVHSRKDRRFYSAMDSTSPHPDHESLPLGLPAPELIVQDELHLISGPLGTMVGLYETAIETLCSFPTPDGKLRRPKIVASTATVRRAAQHVRALFGRTCEIFPPPGPNDGETYFSEVDHQAPGRLYLGVGAAGRSMKTILLRVYVSLLNAAQHEWQPRGDGRQPADPYMTLAGYFNSLRELGGMRRLVEDEVRNRCARAQERRPLGGEGPHPWYRNRELQVEPIELTSRESTFNISRSKERLGRHHDDKESVDVLLASNMISVGVDIDRLGLMVVAGQPKTTSEYIQASSRVGRDEERPGLVVTCYNVHRPRDRSHFEQFKTFHSAFYRHVEAQSLTPFSGPALDRGLAGALVAITRLDNEALTRPEAVLDLGKHRALGDRAASLLADRAARLVGTHQGSQQDAERVRHSIAARAKALLDAWEQIIETTHEGAGQLKYSKLDLGGHGKPLLHFALEQGETLTAEEELFGAPTSMRDVEPAVHVWVYRRDKKPKEREDGPKA